MNRRDLLTYASTAALTDLRRARAQPMPTASDTVPPRLGAGPLFSFGPPSLTFSFMIPGSLDPRITFTRASTATYFDATGTIQTATSNVARWDYDPVSHVLRGLLLEAARTNLLLNSATLGTQSVATSASTYTLSFYGTGTVTLSGSSTAGPLVGTGAFPTRVKLTFTASAGTLMLTVTGSVLNAQLELGAYASSWISTAGVSATRAVESAIVSPLGAWFNAAASAYAVDGMMMNTFPGGYNANWAILDDTTTSNKLSITSPAAGATLVTFAESGGTVYANNANPVAITPPVLFKYAVQAGAGSYKSCGNGGVVFSVAGPAPVGLSRLGLGTLGAVGVIDGYLRKFRYWPRTLSNYELQSVTT